MLVGTKRSVVYDRRVSDNRGHFRLGRIEMGPENLLNVTYAVI